MVLSRLSIHYGLLCRILPLLLLRLARHFQIVLTPHIGHFRSEYAISFNYFLCDVDFQPRQHIPIEHINLFLDILFLAVRYGFVKEDRCSAQIS